MLILKNARVLPQLTESPAHELCDIVVEGEKISSIVPGGSAKGDNTIDLAGKTLLPGLIDAHVHLDCSGMDIWEENEQPDAYRVMRAAWLAMNTLKKGFTALRDCGDRNNVIIDLARAVKDGYVMAPDILAAGVIITPTESGNEYFKGMYAESDGHDEIVKNVRRQIKRGADWIKYMGTGAVMNPGGQPGAPIYTQEEVNTICETAAMRGIPVVAHGHGSTGISYAINAGVRTIEHASILTEEIVESLKNNTNTYLVPTMLPFSRWAEAEGHYPEHYLEKGRTIFYQQVTSVSMAYKAGLKLGFGTDVGTYKDSHGDNAQEFKVRVKYANMKPLDTLLQATKYNSEILRIDNEVGTIKVGKRANLVVIDGKPDENIDDIDRVDLVIKAGVRVWS